MTQPFMYAIITSPAFKSSSASQGILLVTTAYCLWGLTNIGLLYDKSRLAWPSELLRSLTTLLMFSTISQVYSLVSTTLVYNLFTASALICVYMLTNSSGSKEAKDKTL